MDERTYKLPEDDNANTVSEPVAAYSSQVGWLDSLRHQVMDAVASSEDKITLVMCLKMLKDKRGRRVSRHGGLSDEELSARLASYPDWDETEHADLSQIDYSKYKPYRSPKAIKAMEKWL